MAGVVNRLKRAQGQLSGVLDMIEAGRDVESVLQQLKAVTRALDRAAYVALVTELTSTIPPEAGIATEDLERAERLFLTLR
ncbi:metal-sensitive transcriptional regulator [Nocardioides nanhaiensis]|uniref:Metal-sensitive transcriptional regulator n=2 Tax=Nocardioides nanhaiensis TaxID=1476871 RepID=A0ABP8W9W4_9ACTN